MEYRRASSSSTENGLRIDETILDLNKAIKAMLKNYIPDACDIRFDLPEEEPGLPTISVFMYDIQEDVQMRGSERRTFVQGSSAYEPGCAHVQCCYRITYWNQKQGKGGDIDAAQPSNQALLIMNRVLNALLNNRELPNIPNSYSRIMTPTDGLNTLGNFWQAMDNKPKLSLSYAVTVPVKLYGPKSSGSLTPVEDIWIEWDKVPDAALLKKAERHLTVKLLSHLSQIARTQVGMHIKLNVQPTIIKRQSGVEIALSGRISDSACQEVITALNSWLESDQSSDGPVILAWQWPDMAPAVLNTPY
ncbi:DUF4255 domain-containing protein [Pseudomonas koreensis]|uniref:DUF4255 domain-containing protein n=1 Tax=Pseudomonas koreensis TaxID=198620 RepID=UPI003F83787A